ncbi:hypothetical protein ACOMD4_00305 [Streptomyces anulatus]|uniref:hypothetical protein n=1 Tax=Streptomyces anulatus TaxID=1892 RepID=UPI003B76381F
MKIEPTFQITSVTARVFSPLFQRSRTSSPTKTSSPTVTTVPTDALPQSRTAPR